MSEAGFYEVRTILSDGTSLSCESSPCAFALGAEVQTLDVYSGDTNSLFGGEYRLNFTTGSAEDGNEQTATSDCIGFDDSSALDAQLTSITSSSVLVAREAITDPGPGFRYWVTFVGAAVIGDVQPLEISDTLGRSCEQWTVDSGSGSGTVTTQHHLSVATQVTSCAGWPHSNKQRTKQATKRTLNFGPTYIHNRGVFVETRGIYLVFFCGNVRPYIHSMSIFVETRGI